MDARIQLIIKEIERDLRTTVPLRSISRRVNLSASRTRHLFKTETGKSYSQYYRTLRMDEGKRLLEQTNFLTIKEVRVLAGFTTKEQFSRGFKQAFGLTPTEYRLDAQSRDLAKSVTE